MTTTTMGFDPALHGAVAVGSVAGGQTTVATGATVTAQATGFVGKVQQFEGFLKKVGHLANVVLSDVVKFVVPVAQVTALVDPAAAPALRVFTTSVQLVQATVIAAQQRWAEAGSSANEQKLADVLTVVESPILQMFEQVGIKVDTAYVTNLVNGVVAILNAQPAVTLPASQAQASKTTS